MKMNDDFFDKKIKEKIKEENYRVPHYANDAFEKGIKKALNERKYKSKRIAKISAACLVGTIIFGVTLPTYAGDLPILSNIADFFTSNRYENYDKYASDLNITKESKGIKVTINKVIYDGLDLDIFYTIESEKAMLSRPDFINNKLKINNKETSFGCGETGEFLEGNKVYVGTISYGVNQNSLVPKELQEENSRYIEIPDEFLLSIEIDKIKNVNGENITRGKWDFDIPVSNENIKGEAEEYALDAKLESIYPGTLVNKVITTPINTAIQGTYNESKGIDLGFIIFDDKGRYLEAKGGNSSGYQRDDEYIVYFNNQFKEIYEDTKSLTIIPYVDRTFENRIETAGSEISEEAQVIDEVIINSNSTQAMGEAPYKLSKSINLDKETKLTTKKGDEYAEITKVEVKNGKTKLYIKSKYNIFAVPTQILDKATGNVIEPIDNYNNMTLNTTKYIKETKELVVEYNGELLGDNYEVIYYDHSKLLDIYDNDIFEVQIK